MSWTRCWSCAWFTFLLLLAHAVLLNKVMFFITTNRYKFFNYDYLLFFAAVFFAAGFFAAAFFATAIVNLHLDCV